MIDGFTPYPAYRDSGLEWMGKIPAHWELQRAKYFFREIDDRSTSGNEELLSVSHKTGVTPRSQKNVTMFMAESHVGYKRCAPGDIAINTMWAWMAALGVVKQAGIVSPSYGVYRPHASTHFETVYLDELLRTPAYRAEYVVRFTGITSSRLLLYPESFLRIQFPCPPPDEQQAIVRFLRYADRLIRRYIRAKRQLVAILEEQKLLIVRHTLTKGLDSTVPLRPSGVDWLGDVPVHWSVRRLKWVTRLQRGYDRPADRRVPGPFPVVSSGGMIGTHNEARCQGPGVVLGRYGSTEAVFFVEEDFWPHNTALFVTRFHGNRPRWCYYLLRTISKADHAGKSAVPGVDRKDLFQIMVAVPPMTEQDDLVAGIEKATHQLDRAIAGGKQETALLREFRTRLFADVVTGKLDVREAAADLPDEPDDAPGEADEEDALDDGNGDVLQDDATEYPEAAEA